MPANYLATIRYNIIDRCIRDKYRIWQWDHLAHAISVELKEFHGKGKIPSKRTIMADIAAMRSGELGYTAPIIHDRANGYRYANPHFSIHHLSLPAPLINDLREGIALIHQLTKNEKLQRISSSLTRICNYLHIKYDETFQQLIYFEHSLNEPGQRWLDRVYEYTYDRKCMRILYQPFGTKVCTHFIAPAFIKEYNNRWYVFGYDFNLDKIVNLSLDRITEIQPSLRPFFIPDNFSHDLHFKHLYGVTIPDDATPVLIRFSTDIPLSHYMDTKPIHTSQRKVATSEKESTYELYVYDNYEIRSKLRSFGNDLKILSPASLKKEINYPS
ncbi:MAG: WYL domain-containing protein [Saprospiraceae bacterium]|nr:WYL domain-containing protein [Saprospiraceae bacterium]